MEINYSAQQARIDNMALRLLHDLQWFLAAPPNQRFDRD